MLARPAAPLATGVTNNQFCDLKNGWHGNVPWGIETIIIDWSSTAIFENLVKLGHGPVDIEICVLTGIVKNKWNNETEAEAFCSRASWTSVGWLSESW